MSMTSAALASTHAVSPELSTVSLLLSASVGQAGGIVGAPCFQDPRALLRMSERITARRYVRVTGRGSVEQGVHERGRLERRQVVGALAEADQLHRDPELALHPEDDPALGRAVQLGQ